MRILGIDPGLATMGYGVIEAEGQKRKVVQFGTINTRADAPPRSGCAPSFRASISFWTSTRRTTWPLKNCSFPRTSPRASL